MVETTAPSLVEHPTGYLVEHLIDLAEELRLAGYEISTQQYIAAQDLLIALAARNHLPTDPQRLRTLLAPLFCSSPSEQEDFYRRFAIWVQRHA
ncbi:MAG TPA: hypothetical protein VFZ34_24100, partial [Blastocatellia bacterium]|nr:hypothetical protein [Blastocatellia bacterium]